MIPHDQPLPAATTGSTFARRRKAFCSRMSPDSVALFFSAPPQLKSNDVHYRYRQDSDFQYLTGLGEEECALVLLPDREILYLRERNPERETWDGPRLGVERAVDRLGVQEARSIGAFDAELEQWLKNRKRLYYRFGEDAPRDARMFAIAARLLLRSRASDFGPASVEHPAGILHAMRLRKGTEEIEALRECARITAAGHLAIMQAARPGAHEYELEAVLLREFHRQGATEAYPSIVASGPNACILHHIENRRKMEPGDLVLVDAGAEKDFLNADVTRTFPVSGRYSTEQRAVYSIVLEAQKAAIDASVAGSNMEKTHELAVRKLIEGLIDLNVLAGSVDENHESGKYRDFYMHRTGHWLGHDVHDVGTYYLDGTPRPFEDGMVLTVEPGLYFADRENVPAAFRGIGIRIEDDVVIQGTKPLVLTAAIPKELDDIEAMLARAKE
ncbi:MAG: aminopeptidase P N-terminal domain-containing protein [Spirochaetales bacterium]|nr:aminopeptidase P N-terminal domain-containing protein [Leptospiraceae bacterium]MCP5480957.1 aminopeptidase P N-terminal domain-containing protein [Spirochaetales bacterium]